MQKRAESCQLNPLFLHDAAMALPAMTVSAKNNYLDVTIANSLIKKGLFEFYLAL
jgi:hypothetical protein